MTPPGPAPAPAPGEPVLTVALTGVAGYLGERLARRLLDRGLKVRALVHRRRPDPVDGLALIDGALPDPIPPALFEGAQVLVHCAWTGVGTDAAGHLSNVDSALRLAEAARASGVRRMVFNSSIVARPDAPSEYGRAKHEAEERLLRIDGLELVVLRPGEIIGPSSRGLIPRMIELVDRPVYKPIPMAPDENWLQPIHIDDLCEAECRVLEGRVRGPCVLHLADPDGVRLEAFIQLVARARRGRAAWLLRLPRWMVRGSIPPPPRVASRADLERLGLSLRPLADAVADAVASYEPRVANTRS